MIDYYRGVQADKLQLQHNDPPTSLDLALLKKRAQYVIAADIPQ